jgi:alkanesulfonate monooxygenase SsuD/methylene tetrahydromethanopterin reductase-like flavin-dependent oxidoreductase (luciferase family)
MRIGLQIPSFTWPGGAERLGATLGERFERLEETLQVVKQMWSDENGPFEDRHYRLAETLNLPQALSRPHPPILIGGAGERKTLRLVARYGDACNLFLMLGDDAVRHKLEVLQRHCDELGRDSATIEKTTLGTVNPPPPGRVRAT